MSYPMRVRRLAGAGALIAASALALAGCGGDGGTSADAAKAAKAAAASTSATPTPTPPPPPSSAAPATSPAAPATAPAPKPTVATLPDHTGSGVGKALAAARKAGLRSAVYLQGTGLSLDGGGKRASSWAADEEVCDQIDDPDDVNASFDVAFSIPRAGRDCAGRPLHTAAPAKTAKPSDGGSSGGGTSGGGGTRECEITSPAGNCYADGQFCAARHHGLSTHGRGGEYLTCEQDAAGRWRWSDGVPG
ncbi:hypothetical protein ACN6K4_002371 [Streptomyces hayashii]